MNWQTYSIFISSTFSDMHSERDYLNMVVFPQINEELRKYAITLKVIDLRWGINSNDTGEETTEAKVMRICLNEIERSKPFFLGLLGNRYGWTPPSIPSYLKEKGVRDNISITAMEIEYRLLDKNGVAGCLFMERNLSALQNIDERLKQMYDDGFSSNYEIAQNNIKKLDSLKKYIKERLKEDQKEDCYQYYTPIWNGNGFDGLKEFGETVKNFILREITQTNSFSQLNSHPFYNAINLQNQFLFFKSRNTFIRENLMIDLIEKIKQRNGVISISGPSGYGKSCIYARLVKYFMDKEEEYFILYHTPSVGGRNRFLDNMIDRWIYELESEFQLPHIISNSFQDKLTYFKRLISKPKTSKKIILFVDAIDEFIEETEIEYLSFFPRKIQSQCVLVCTTPSDQLEKINSYHHSIENVSLSGISKEEAYHIVNIVLKSHSKELDESVKNAMINHHSSEGEHQLSPLWLTMALNRILSFNEKDFAKIRLLNQEFNIAFREYATKNIEGFPISEESMFPHILKSLSDYFGELPLELFQLLSVSLNGLEEKTLASVIGKSWNLLTFAFVKSNLQEFITEQGNNKAWCITHKKCRLILPDSEKKELSRRLASFYVEEMINNDVVNDNVFFYLVMSEDSELAFKYFGMFNKNKDKILDDIVEASLLSSPTITISFIIDIYSKLKSKRHFCSGFLLTWELKEICSRLAVIYNKYGKYQQTLFIIDRLYEYLGNNKVGQSVKNMIFLLTQSEREVAIGAVYNRERQKQDYEDAIKRLKICDPISLLFVPIARKYYKWQIYKL